MSGRGRNWCFTLFEYTLPLFLSLPDWAEYLVFQEEESPTTKKRHIQGYCTLKKPQRLSFLKTKLGNGVHLEIAKGSSSSNRDYCRKDDSRVSGPWEFGVCAEQGSNKRKTMERFQEDPEEVRLSDPKLYRRCLATKINKEFAGLLLPAFDRPWQSLVEKVLDEGPDDRTIIWVYGSQGNEGKTTWAKSKIQTGWFYSRGGKGENIKYSYAEHLGHCIFDLPRQVEDVLQYTVLEEIKDRLIRSSKYEPIDFNCSDKVHVVILSNFLPQLDVEYDSKGNLVKKPLLSKDRLCIVNIDESVVVRGGQTVTFDQYME
ncbi:replication-associated protein [Tomato yellow spot alphasatellite 2]|uniref:Replication-associated protein n=1 Tax=Tomato yellow spot alphasatellite 2 TaxID=2651595 RepID=A0A6B7LRM2_9VIRU|nr:replication-associated protein [Tomato yellow spot alphasatellite 2]QFG39777.1 replication-associated protein [Tomato yellow spot alphasatellite 2]QFG39778.1 replication-associated protein [Tomato yellow spot alphasatellite 2]